MKTSTRRHAKIPWGANQTIEWKLFQNMKSVDEIRRILRANQPELEDRFHVEEIALFGSYARGDQTDASDLDILVKLNAPLGWEFVDLCDHLAKLLETNVDVVTRGAIDRKPLLRHLIERDLIRV